MSLAEKMFPDTLATIEELEDRYPSRGLAAGAVVSRVGPSPTGAMHLGTLYVALISKRFADQTDGSFFLRNEDTDTKREVEGAASIISRHLGYFGLNPSEGLQEDGGEVGGYGPYTQSERGPIYHAVVKHMVRSGLAYACFAAPEELESIRDRQLGEGAATGYYGDWATWRDRSPEEVEERIDSGDPYVVRFRSQGDSSKEFTYRDKAKGELLLRENSNDIVLLKRPVGDGPALPTYHLAHVVDDHLMRSTLVVRGDEWVSSLPTHLQLFQILGWAQPSYAHVAPINKLDEGSKRKLSKRKDPEANVGQFINKGFPAEAVIEYLLTLANPSFDEWRKRTPEADHADFALTYKGLQKGEGPLFDMDKLRSISYDVLAKKTAEELYEDVLQWATDNDPVLLGRMQHDSDYVTSILAIERGGKRPRKDHATYQEVAQGLQPFFDYEFEMTQTDFMQLCDHVEIETARSVVDQFLESYDESDDKDDWLSKMKAVADDNNFATSRKLFAEDVDYRYIGSMAEFMEIFRVLLVGKKQSQDLYSIMQVMGSDRVANRLRKLN